MIAFPIPISGRGTDWTGRPSKAALFKSSVAFQKILGYGMGPRFVATPLCGLCPEFCEAKLQGDMGVSPFAGIAQAFPVGAPFQSPVLWDTTRASFQRRTELISQTLSAVARAAMGKTDSTSFPEANK